MRIHQKVGLRDQGWDFDPSLVFGLGGGYLYLHLISMGTVMGCYSFYPMGFVGVFRQPPGPQVVHKWPVLCDIGGSI